MKELKIDDLSLVIGGNPAAKVVVGVATYVAGREVIDPIYDRIRENIVNTHVEFPLSVPINANVSPSWVAGRAGNSSLGSNYMPGSSYPTKTSKTNQSGSDYGDGCNYQ